MSSRLAPVLLFAFVGLRALAADPESDARKFLADVAGGRFGEATKRFDPTMSAALPAPKLAEVWAQVQQTAGTFQGAGAARTEAAGAFTAVLVRCRFTKGELDAKVVFDKEGRIAGLFFVPPSAPAPAWAPPPYADLAKLREVEVTVGSEWPLAGTLTLPLGVKGKVPAIVLVHGSGPHDRDETIGPNKPFRDLALGLATRGIAVLRYEKRTKVHGARLAKEAPRFTLDDETVNDAIAAVELLAGRGEVDAKRIFVAGHSLGGTMAPRIAQRSKKVAGLVILAGSTRPFADVVVAQLEYLATLDGVVSDDEKIQIDAAKRFRTQSAAKDLAPDAEVDLLGAKVPGSYVLDLRDWDPATAAASLTVPILVLQGGRDYQVTRADFEGWKRALAKKPAATFHFFDDLNHLFLRGTGGPPSPSEYGTAGHVDAAVLSAIEAWIPKT